MRAFTDVAVAFRTRHHDINSLKSYHSLFNDTNIDQLRALFSSPQKSLRQDYAEVYADTALTKESVAQVAQFPSTTRDSGSHHVIVASVPGASA